MTRFVFYIERPESHGCSDDSRGRQAAKGVRPNIVQWETTFSPRTDIAARHTVCGFNAGTSATPARAARVVTGGL